MSLGIREVTEEEIEWLKVQLDPPGYYLDQFLASNKKYGAKDLDSKGKASRLKGQFTRAIGQRNLNIRVHRRETVVFLINDDIDGKAVTDEDDKVVAKKNERVD